MLYPTTRTLSCSYWNGYSNDAFLAPLQIRRYQQVAAGLVPLLEDNEAYDVLKGYVDFSTKRAEALYCHVSIHLSSHSISSLTLYGVLFASFVEHGSSPSQECNINLAFSGAIEDHPVMGVTAYCQNHIPKKPGVIKAIFSPLRTIRAAHKLVQRYSQVLAGRTKPVLGGDEEEPMFSSEHRVEPGGTFIALKDLQKEFAMLDKDVLQDAIEDALKVVSFATPYTPLEVDATKEEVWAWRWKWSRRLIKSALESGRYLNITFASSVFRGSSIMKVIDGLRKDKFTLWADGVVSDTGNLLCLLGKKGSRTPMHLDWTHAENLAFGVGDKENVRPLAKWTFIPPHAISHLDNFLKSKGFEDGLKGGHFIEEDTLNEFAAAMPADVKVTSAACEQLPGELIKVPVGWAHQVENLQDCVKFAWDLWEPDRFALYYESYKTLGSVFFRQAKDYMATNTLLLRGAAEACGGLELF